MRMIWVFPLATLVVIGGCSQPRDDEPSLGTSFYAAPNPLPAGSPGELIRLARVPSPRDFRAWVMLYHSRSAAGMDIVVSGFLAAPEEPAPAGGYPVVSWAHGTTGVADACAPSRAAMSGSLVGDEIVGTLVRHGYVVAATDYEGLGVAGPHPYLLGESEGRSVLDAARAARSIPGVEVSGRTAFFGYSQGGHAALWAAQLAGAYAPDLNVAAVAAVAPVGDLVGVANYWAVADSLQPYLLMALDSWSTFYGQALEPILTPNGVEARAQFGRRCTGQFDWQAFGSGLLERTSTTWAPWIALAGANTPGSAAMPAPVLVLHGDADSLVPIETAEAVVDALCAHAAEVEFRVYRGAGHEVLDPGLADATAWIGNILRGAPPINSCRSGT
jgi:pimeloyl-ACP methyl ester carboxylesterase